MARCGTCVCGGACRAPPACASERPRAGGERPGGKEATRRITELVPPDTPVRLVYDVERRDRYDRTLAYVDRLRDGLFLNAALVREGYAAAYTVPPNVCHVDELVAFQRRAREAGRGLWSACGGVGVPAGLR